jgi:hypothetical protein
LIVENQTGRSGQSQLNAIYMPLTAKAILSTHVPVYGMGINESITVVYVHEITARVQSTDHVFDATEIKRQSNMLVSGLGQTHDHDAASDRSECRAH